MSKRSILILAALVAAGLTVYLMLGREQRTSSKDAGRAPTSNVAAGTVAGPTAPVLAEPARVSGRVTNTADGAPIVDATVHLTRVDGDIDAAPGGLTTSTDDDGRWTVAGVSAGEYRASAAAAGFLPSRGDALSLAAGADVSDVDLQLAPGGNRLTGLVADVTGGPIGGAVVQVTPLHGMLSVREDYSFAALTDADGRYTVQLGDGRYRATARHAEYGRAVDYVELSGGDERLDFALTPGGVIEGTVRFDETGDPVPGARVRYWREATVTMPGGRAMAVGAGGGIAMADADGKFALRGIESGAVSIAAAATGAATHEPMSVPVGIAEHVTGVDVYVSRAFAISGTVVIDGDARRPAANVVVIASAPGDGGVRASLPTDRDGAFRVDGLAPGRYRLQTSSKLYVDSLGLGESVGVDSADVRGVVVSVKGGATISGRVEPAGVAEVGIEVRPDRDKGGLGLGLDLDSFPLIQGSVRTGDDGAFVIGPVLPGSHAVVARAGDGRKGTVDVEVGDDGVRDVVIRLEEGASVSGRVVDADGRPVADAMVALGRERKNERVVMIVNGRDVLSEQAPTREDGTFVIRGLEAGDYAISVRDRTGQTLAWAKPKHAGRPAAPIPVSVQANRERRGLELRVEARNGVIRGVALGPDGSPAADTWVTATRLRDDAMLGALPPGPAGDHGPPPGAEPGDDDEPERVEVRTMVVVADGDGDGGHGGGTAGLGFGGSAPPALTDDRGRFEISGLRKGTYSLMAEGLRGTARGFERGVDTGSDTTVKLVSLTRIDGAVTFDGKPVDSFRVRLEGAAMRHKTVRDASGRFSIHRVDPGDYTVEITAPEGKGQATVTVIAGKPAEVKVELVRLQQVTGKLVDANGAPIAGAMVLIGSGSGMGGIAIEMDSDAPPMRTADDGAFRIEAGAGKHMLIALAPDSPRPLLTKAIEVAPGRDLDLGTLTSE